MTLEEKKAYDKALQQIQVCLQRGEKGTHLDLSSLGLTTLPPEIGQLTALNELHLQYNQLSALPPEIGQLTALTRLDLNDNQLSALPPEIGQLTALTWLHLDNNQLSALPPEIGQLTALTELNISSNKLSALPPEIGQLTALTRLYLSNNQLSALPPEIGQLTALILLDLGNNQLSVLPPEIGQLTALTELILNINQLSALPPEIGQLTALTRLSLWGSQLSMLPPEIGQLTALTRLILSNNQLSVLPPEIGQLTALTSLSLYTNQLSSLPAEVGQLTALTELYLQKNQLSALPPEIGQLKNLTALSLFDNQLAALPSEFGHLENLEDLWLQGNRFTQLPAFIGSLKKLKQLSLRKNKLSRLPPDLRQLKSLEALYLHDNPRLNLPPEVLGPRRSEVEGNNKPPANPQTILDYYFGSRAKNSQPLNEVKLILVGRGGAGKTSTVRALLGEPFDTHEKSTPGIALCDLPLKDCKGGPVTAHVWDFAGQVITHSLHQFFFSVRSVYVLVLSGRENNEREDAEYWLRLIRAFGTDETGKGPPVIVVLNQWDVPGCRPKVDRLALQERYPFIAAFVEMDCQSRKGVANLKKTLSKEVDKLKWIREPFQPEWAAVRKALTAAGKKQRAHLSYAEYRALCTTHGVTDGGQQDSLSEILHNLGAALNYRTDPRLREATVLQPLWLTKNVYGLVRQAEKQSGVLKQADVDAVLAKEKDVKMREYLVQIMERFEIAYVPRSSSGGMWLVPQALPIGQPKGVESFAKEPEATHLRYTYEALPEGLVPRAIVRLHEFIEEANGKPQQWASGAVLTREGARALLRAETTQQVMITVTGPTKARQQLAGLCQAEMRDINAEIRGLNPLEETKVQGAWVSTAILRADERNRQQTGVPVPSQGTVMIDPRVPNDAFTTLPARQEFIWKPTVFISYSKSNVAQRKRLESELKILHNEGLLERHWHDRMIDPGDEWDETIQRELRGADVILILASAAALATDYITQHEIPKALELHQQGETIVVPIVLESCRWDKTALGTLNALPEKARPLNKWKPAPDGWNSIANGLAQVFEKLMAQGQKRPTHTSP
jgi:internalin A